MGRGGHRRYRHLKVFEFAVLSLQLAVACMAVYFIYCKPIFFVYSAILTANCKPDTANYKQWHIIERSKFKRKQQYLVFGDELFVLSYKLLLTANLKLQTHHRNYLLWESFGRLVLLGYDVTTFIPVTYQRSSLLRPSMEVSSCG